MGSNKIEDSGGLKRLKTAFNVLRSQLPAKVAEIGSQMALEASLRAPSPQDEYNVMMAGEGNPEGLRIVGGPGDPTGGSSTPRVRFDKPEGFYLQPMIARNVQMVGPMVVGVGNISELNVASQYQWTNIDGVTYTSSFPFWECWEGGINGTFAVYPVNYKHKALLSPAPGVTREMMTKTIPAHYMYSAVDVNRYEQEFLIPAIRNIVREA